MIPVDYNQAQPCKCVESAFRLITKDKRLDALPRTRMPEPEESDVEDDQAQHPPIGSGTVEAACKTLVT